MTPLELALLRQVALDATPGPWKTCAHDGAPCNCGFVWSIPADHPILKVEYGEWGDHYPALRVVRDGASDITLEAYMEHIPYGSIPFEKSQANSMFVSTFDPAKCLEMLDEINRLREELIARVETRVGPERIR